MVKPDNPLDRRIAIMDLFDAELDQAQRALKQANNSIQGHLATINRLERENVMYQLRAGETPAEPEGATV